MPVCDMDVAIADVIDPDEVSSWHGDDQTGYNTPVDIIQADSEMRVKKFGRTTGLTFGTIDSKISGPFPLDYSVDHFKARIWFRDIWLIRSDPMSQFALGGDSGSLVVTEDGKFSVGLLFAADAAGEYGWVIPMDKILNEMRLTLVSNHGV